MIKTKILLIGLFSVFFATAASSHSLWLTADNYNPKIGETVTIEIGWGHGFNRKEPLKKNMLRRIYIVSPDGKNIVPAKISETRYRFTPARAGRYAAGAEINPGFMSKTTTGRVKRNKTGLDNVINCMRFDIRAKTVITAGEDGRRARVSAGHPLEIVPLDDTAHLRKNGVLTVMATYNGSPLANSVIEASHEGFHGRDHPAALSVKTDSKGTARIPLSHGGKWILQVKHNEPYPDKAVCDNYMYSASFTFIVK
ncbi:MAG: DUF4198 domain-containing protein [Spirochaetes bacterium]|nr:DUF4198 domain-containing protein [Spirochaetota bacterium]